MHGTLYVNLLRHFDKSDPRESTDARLRHFSSFGTKILAECEGNLMILYHKTNKEDSTVLCSVVKH